jgi:hypothetical protein
MKETDPKTYKCQVENWWWLPAQYCTEKRRVVEGVSYFTVTTPKGGERTVWWTEKYFKVFDGDMKTALYKCIRLAGRTPGEDIDLVTLNGCFEVELTASELRYLDEMSKDSINLVFNGYKHALMA